MNNVLVPYFIREWLQLFVLTSFETTKKAKYQLFHHYKPSMHRFNNYGTLLVIFIIIGMMYIADTKV